MSLETLLEAAEFLDTGPRGDEKAALAAKKNARNFHPYAKPTPKPKTSGLNNNKKGHGGSIVSMEDDKDKRRAGGAGTREVHNKLEKNRRAHLKECFEQLKEHIPNMEDKKSSNLSILRSSLRYIQALKRKEKEFEQDMQRLAREKIRHQDSIVRLKRDLHQLDIDFDLNIFMQATTEKDNDTNSTSTASEGRSPIVSEDDENSEKGKNSSKTTPKSTSNVKSTTSAPKATSIQKMISDTKSLSTTSVLNTISVTTPDMPDVSPTPVISFEGPKLLKTIPPFSTTSSTDPVPTTVPQTTAKTQIAQLLQRQITQRALAQQQQLQQKQLAPTPPGTPISVVNIPTVQPQLTIPASSLRLPTNIQATLTMKNPAATTGAVPVATAATTTLTIPTVTATVVPTTTATMSTVPQLIKTEPGQVATPMTIANKPASTIVTFMANTNSLQLTTQAGTTQTSTVSNPLTVLSTSQIANLTSAVTPTKQIVNPGTQILTHSSHLSAISQMVQQAIGQVTSAQTSTAQIVSAAPATGVTQGLASIAGITPVTQIITPITVMTPAMVQIPQNAAQTQLNNAVQQSFIKSVGTIPMFIQQPFLQQTQVVGQQDMKPVIMVTMPPVGAGNVGTPTTTSIPTTSASTVQLAVAIPVPKTTS